MFFTNTTSQALGTASPILQVPAGRAWGACDCELQLDANSTPLWPPDLDSGGKLGDKHWDGTRDFELP